MVRDLWKGKNFQGDPITFANAITSRGVPLSIQNYQQIKNDPKSSFVLGSMILEGMGLSTNTYQYQANWETSTSKEMEQFRKEAGKDKFKTANNDFNRAYNEWFYRMSQTSEYRNLSEEGKDKLTTNVKTAIKEQIFKEYGFKYRKPGKTPQKTEEEKVIKGLAPK